MARRSRDACGVAAAGAMYPRLASLRRVSSSIVVGRAATAVARSAVSCAASAAAVRRSSPERLTDSAGSRRRSKSSELTPAISFTSPLRSDDSARHPSVAGYSVSA